MQMEILDIIPKNSGLKYSQHGNTGGHHIDEPGVGWKYAHGDWVTILNQAEATIKKQHLQIFVGVVQL
ncbi:hypothetical protein ACT7C1_21650 [Bacillus paranthracis]